MSEFNIEVEGGSSVRLPTAGKYCDRDIVIAAIDVSETAVKQMIAGVPRVFKIPEGVTKIRSGAFYEASLLESLYIPESVTTIYHNAFNNCGKLALTSLPKTLTTIGSNAFRGCTAITELTFEGTPQTIDTTAFYNCTNLLTINVPWAEGEVANAPWGATNATINYNYTGG